jgi:hypothetical protein
MDFLSTLKSFYCNTVYTLKRHLNFSVQEIEALEVEHAVDLIELYDKEREARELWELQLNGFTEEYEKRVNSKLVQDFQLTREQDLKEYQDLYERDINIILEHRQQEILKKKSKRKK